MSNESNQNPFSLIADFEGDISNLFDIEIGDTLPVLPLRNMVLFPGVVVPINVGRKSSLRLVRDAYKKGEYFAVTCQMNPDEDMPAYDKLYTTGTVAKVLRIIELPDHSTTVIVQGYSRVKLLELVQERPYFAAKVSVLEEVLPSKRDKEYTALAEACKDMTFRYIHASDNVRDEASFAIRNISNDVCVVNFICTNMPISIAEKIDLLMMDDQVKRAFRLLTILNRENQFVELKARIQNQTREELDQQQKEYFLHQQIKNIQDELGESSADDVQQLQETAAKKALPAEVRATFDKELNKLKSINPQSPDYNVLMTYLQTVVSLPWGVYSKDNLNLANAEKILNRDHYGLEKVKERILEHLAVLKMRGDMKSPIICLYGPPGVGKTSLGKSVADALKRKYVRISLGGVHDEAEIRGHRRTYIGAMPGRVIKSVIKAGTNNPVFILDEIDKVSGNNFNGDPSSALLEVLDPEQNGAFHDNYLDMDFDLSKVLFIATANNLNSIPQPLLDRMELINMSGYLTEEKIEIAKRHLLPKKLEENGLEKEVKVKMPVASIERIVESYTRESGVRQLEKQIDKMLRKIARKYVSETLELAPGNAYTVKPKDVEELLGKPLFNRDKYQGNKYAGVVTGLAWTSVGGEILFVETSLSRGKGQLTITGNLGDVMKESAVLALEYVKSHTDMLDIDYRLFGEWNIHIHVPEGAVPKDGPSAGITIATSLASALTQRKIRPNIAMTGEITLRGKVLPVGGIKEKILAAKRAGITDILLSEDNRKDIEEIAEIYLSGLTFHYVENVKDVFDFALLEDKVHNPLDFTRQKEKEEVRNAV